MGQFLVLTLTVRLDCRYQRKPSQTDYRWHFQSPTDQRPVGKFVDEGSAFGRTGLKQMFGMGGSKNLG